MTDRTTVTADTLDLAADLTTAYIGYARETITDRALPDVRDGLKPVQRRILYAMNELGLRQNQPHRKCARIVGEVLGKFHPHGDQSVYDALVRLAQPFRMGVPLVDGQGNFGCFTGDTKVKLLDGSDRTFEELAQMYTPDQVFYVYSIDDEGNVVVGEGRHSRVTRKRVEIIELELDNGEIIRCTPDHRFMLRDGSYKRAKDLTPDDSLMAGYFTTAPVREGLNDYLMILNPATGTYEFVHHLADRYNEEQGKVSVTKGPFVRHHKDFNRWNNNPSNIKRMGFGEHLHLHSKRIKELWEDPAFRCRQREGVQEYYRAHPQVLEKRRRRIIAQNRSESFRQQMAPVSSKRMRRYFQEHPEVRQEISRQKRTLWRDPAYRQKMSKALRGIQKRPLSPEERERVARIISKKSRAMWQNEAKRAEIVRAIRLALNSPKVRDKLSKSSKSLWQDPEYRAKFSPEHFSRMARTLWQKPGTLKAHRQRMRKLWQSQGFRTRHRRAVRASNLRRLAKNPRMMEQLTERASESLRQSWQDEDYKRRVMRSKILRYGSYLLSQLEVTEITPELYNQMRYNNCFPRFAKAMTYFDSFEEFLQLAAVYNHRIVAKRYLSERVDVYDITVELYHNFLLSSGVFVHNSVDGDGAAQMRYTEARLTAVAETLLEHLDMDTVEWMDNFDNTLKEPIVLPGMFPNLLVNGAAGIAVGMATNMPPHNLGEVCDAIIHVAQGWRRRNRFTVDELMRLIPGPDFPTGGIIYRYRDDGEGPVDTIRQAYETGRGRIVMQSRVGIEDIGGGKANIIVSELPYGVLKNTVIEKLAKEVRRGRISGVTDVRDESDYEGMRVVIEVSRQADAKDVLPQLLKYSQLRETFGVINLALVPDNGATRPDYLSLRDILTYFVTHRLEVIVRRSRYELEKRQARLHIVEGLLKALDVLDEVIDTIRRSRTVETAHNNLMSKFKFTDIQAQAILDMQLRRLTALERNKLAQEEKDLRARIRYLEGLLASEKKRLEVVVEETTEIKEKYAVPRRTIIVESEEASSGTFTTQADLVMPEAPQMLVLTPDAVERHPADGFSYRGSRSLTKGAVREVHLAHMAVDPSDEVILLTNRGRGWKGMVGFVPENASPQAMGLEHKESIIAMAVLDPETFLVLGTRGGKVKRTRVEDLSLLERQWGPVIGLTKDDELLFGDVAAAGAHVLFYTSQGQLLRIDGDTVNPQQTDTATGVVGVALKGGDRLLGGMVVPDAARDEKRWHVAVISKNGYAHRTALSEYQVKGRGSQGVRCLYQSKAAGPMGDVAVGRDGVLDIYLEDGRRQRMDLRDLPETARDALGKRLLKADKPVTRLVLLVD